MYSMGWVGVEIIRNKAVLSSTGLELELSLAKDRMQRNSKEGLILIFSVTGVPQSMNHLTFV